MSIGRLHAYLLRRLSRGDALAFAAMTALAIAVVVTGRIERSHLRPRAALEATAMITDLDVPRRLPNVALTDGFGEPRSIPLWQRVHRPRAVVTFYAPWCGPCQRELPALHRTLGEHADILPECRVHFLRFFISMKKDGEKWRIAQQRAAKAAEEAALEEVQLLATNE